MLLTLFETPAGYALFKVLDEGILNDDQDLMGMAFRTVEEAKTVVELVDFKNFSEVNNAVDSTLAGNFGVIPDLVAKLLEEVDTRLKPTLLISDHKLGQAIMEEHQMKVLYNANVLELIRCIRSQLHGLLSLTNESAGELKSGMEQMSSILSQNLAIRKMQVNPNVVDSMIKFAIRVHDDIEKNLKVYMKRFKSWYGDHFPELQFVVEDDLTLVKAMSLLWHRSNIDDTDFSPVLSSDVARAVKEAAKMSTGNEINPPEFPLLNDLADQIVDMIEWKNELETYLELRMQALAPNVTKLAGSLIGARLIVEAGNLLKLSKKPASIVSMYGAKKALFCALRTGDSRTPKHGYIFNSKFVQEADSEKIRGKMSRALACKIVLAARVDSFGEGTLGSAEFASDSVLKIESRLKRLNEEILIRELKEKDRTPAVELVPVSDIPHKPYQLLSNVHQTNDLGRQHNARINGTNTKGFQFKGYRRRGPRASNKREFEKFMKSDAGGNFGTQIPRVGDKRSYDTSFPTRNRNSFGQNLTQIWPMIPNKKIKFSQADDIDMNNGMNGFVGSGCQIKVIDLSR